MLDRDVNQIPALTVGFTLPVVFREEQKVSWRSKEDNAWLGSIGSLSLLVRCDSGGLWISAATSSLWLVLIHKYPCRPSVSQWMAVWWNLHMLHSQVRDLIIGGQCSMVSTALYRRQRCPRVNGATKAVKCAHARLVSRGVIRCAWCLLVRRSASRWRRVRGF